MRSLIVCLFTLVSLTAAENGAFENSTLSLSYPASVTLDTADFSYMPENNYRFVIDGAPVLIGLQNDLEANRKKMLEQAKNNVTRYLDNARESTLTTYGSLQRCDGLKLSGTAKHPKFSGPITVYLVTFTNGQKSVLLIAIEPESDTRFRDALQVMSKSIKLKH